jgi:hypothetical protein
MLNGKHYARPVRNLTDEVIGARTDRYRFSRDA